MLKQEQEAPELSPTFVPTPTETYERAKRLLGVAPSAPVLPRPAVPPLPLPQGARVLMWKQDPSVSEIGIRKAFLPRRVFAGPRDARIKIEGLPVVSPNVFGDFIVAPTAVDAFDAVHTFAVVRQVLTMYQRSLQPNSLPWQWNTGGNVDPLGVHPHGLANVPNAFYSRNQKVLKFGFFTPTGGTSQVFTCRSLDITAHECGHAILDGLKPGWILAGNPPQTGGLHESFGDLTAIFLALSQMDQVEAIIAQTKADLHDKNFLADVAEQFGAALGRPNGLRNADNDLKLSQVGTEVHAISQVFTGGVYDVLADLFASERNPAKKDDALVLYESGQYIAGLVLRAIIPAPNTGATYANIVNKMRSLAVADGKPQVSTSIRDRFIFREVLAPGTPLTDEGDLPAEVTDPKGAVQDRRGCCGTMQLEEYLDKAEQLEGDIEEFRKAITAQSGGGRK